MMTRKCFSTLALLSILACMEPTGGWALETKFKITEEMLMPKGEYYEATVPDTLDLAERARLAVGGLTRFLNPRRDYAPFGHGFYNVTKPFFMRRGWGCWGKITESMIMTRLMSGSRENLDIERKSFEGLLKNREGGWIRGMMSFMSLYEQTPDPVLRQLIAEMAEKKYIEKAVYDGDTVNFRDKPAENQDTKFGVRGYGWESFINGSILRGMSHWADQSGDEASLELAHKLKNFVMKPRFWQPEAAPKAVAGSDHGQFMGHHHSFLAALMGLLRYAEATDDARIMQFVRDGYEYFRNFGIARIGLFAEMCSTGDMIFLAIKLSELGVGDYWDDVDSYVRNHLVEQQVTDADKLRRAAEAKPILAMWDPKNPVDMIQQPVEEMGDTYQLDPIDDSTDNVFERSVGIYLSGAAHPTHIPKHHMLFTICCSGNAMAAVYWTWESAIRCQVDVAQVNLLLNRASPWLDMDSYLPYEGKVVIRNKTARKLSVRMPGWVDMDAVQTNVNGKVTNPFRVARYLVLDVLSPKDVITITFPMVESTETYTLKWKEEDFWMEGTNPGSAWITHDEPDRFTFHFKGNTVVEITPRYEGNDYKHYENRAQYRQTKAPMKKVTRFVSPVTLKW